MTKTKALFLDLDGTIRQPISDNIFIQDPGDQKLIDGAAQAIEYFADRDYLIFGVTNQAGVHYGHKRIEECYEEQKITIELCPLIRKIVFCPDLGEKIGQITIERGGLLSQVGLDRIYHGVSPEELYCPTLMEHNFSSFRKPGAGMIEYLLYTYDIDICNSLMVGDMSSDRDCIKNINCGFLWAGQWLEMFGLDR